MAKSAATTHSVRWQPTAPGTGEMKGPSRCIPKSLSEIGESSITDAMIGKTLAYADIGEVIMVGMIAQQPPSVSSSVHA